MTTLFLQAVWVVMHWGYVSMFDAINSCTSPLHACATRERSGWCMVTQQ